MLDGAKLGIMTANEDSGMKPPDLTHQRGLRADARVARGRWGFPRSPNRRVDAADASSPHPAARFTLAHEGGVSAAPNTGSIRLV